MTKIEVTQEDINKSELSDCRKTPVAIAVTRISGHRCCEYNGVIAFNDLTFYATLPMVVQFIEDCYQSGRAILPFSFDIEFNEGVPF